MMNTVVNPCSCDARLKCFISRTLKSQIKHASTNETETCYVVCKKAENGENQVTTRHSCFSNHKTITEELTVNNKYDGKDYQQCYIQQ